MTLSSQSARSSRPGPSRRGKKGPPWRAILVLGLLLAGVWFLFLRDADGVDAPPVADAGVAAGVDTAPDAAAPEEAAGGGGTPPAATPRDTAATVLSRPAIVDRLKEGGAAASASGADAAPAEAAPPPPPVRRATPTARSAATGNLADGLALLDAGDLIKGRNLLSSLLLEGDEPLPAPDADLVRNKLTELNSRLVFSPEPVPNDNVTTAYEVQPGDLLGSIAIRAKVPYALLELINQTKAPRIQVGQTLKLLRGPVHARVSKTDFTMDLYAFGDDGAPVFLCALPVGLGANDGTPLGRWRVGTSKVTNPSWKNPRTGQYYAATDPDIPIGEYWIPIVGIDGDAVDRKGFGIHGTNEPDSIGSMQSMGCVRLLDGDIELVYAMLEPRDSEVLIVP